VVGALSAWAGGPWLESGNRGDVVEIATELEELGYTRLWLSAGFGDGVPSIFGELLAATTRLQVASGILSIWHAGPQQAADAVAELERAHPGRFLLGLGVSHAPLVESSGEAYRRPYSRMVSYLDDLDAASPPVPPERRVLAALGPRMLELSGQRAVGAHPYFVPVEHTVQAREQLGSGVLLAPEVAVVLEPDAATARAVARRYMDGYLQLPNYTSTLRRLGWSEEDLSGGGSDALVDALVPWGTTERVAARVAEHHAAGADEVAVQVLTASGALPRDEFAELAHLLL